MILNKQPQKGEIFEYEKEIMFKGTEVVRAKVVAVSGRRMLLDNGDEICFLVA